MLRSLQRRRHSAVPSQVRVDDSGMASHPKIVIRTPDDDLARNPLAAPGGIGWTVGVSLEVGKDAITAFSTHAVEKCFEMISRCRHCVLPRFSPQSLKN